MYFRMDTKKHIEPETIRSIMDIVSSINGAFIGNDKLFIPLNGSIDNFVYRILNILGKNKIPESYSSNIFSRICYVTGNPLPILDIPQTKEKKSKQPTIIIGAGSNNIEIGNPNDYVISSMNYWEKGSLRRIYVQVDGVEKFSYYIDLKTKKRFLKNPETIQNFVHFNILIKKEIIFLNVENEEQIYEYKRR